LPGWWAFEDNEIRLVIASAIGFISTGFMAMPPMRDGTSDWSSLEFPGMGAAFLVGSRRRRRAAGDAGRSQQTSSKWLESDATCGTLATSGSATDP
jgi:hypothetical protein